MDHNLKADDTRVLVGKAQGGDNQAFNCLVERYSSRLECLIHLRMGAKLRAKVEVEDILQDTLFKAFRSLKDFRWTSEGSYYRWLGGIAEHVILNRWREIFGTDKRDANREIPFSEGDSEGGRAFGFPAGNLRKDGTSPSNSMRRMERFQRLEKVLAALSPDRREVILLALVHEMPTREIAERMNRSPDAVSMLLLRALRQLKAAFGSTDSLHLPQLSLADCFRAGGAGGRDLGVGANGSSERPREASVSGDTPEAGPAAGEDGPSSSPGDCAAAARGRP